MAGERRKYLRVLFEETIQVETTEWTDPMATGLDISLNGTRFHCEHSLSEGESVTIVFRPDLKIQGEVRWCWPIEWYYQAAVEFVGIGATEQTALREYITETTGEPYPEYSEEEQEPAETSEAASIEELGLDDEDDLFEDEELEVDEDLIDEPVESIPFDGTLRPVSFAGKRVVLVDDDSSRIEAISEYLKKRTRFDVESRDTSRHLWPMLKGKPCDIILLSWSLEEESALELLQTIRHRYPKIPVIVLAGAVSLEERLQGLNEGAADFITRPVHVSSIAQAILKLFAFMEEHDEVAEESDDDMELNDDDLDLGDDFLEDEF